MILTAPPSFLFGLTLAGVLAYLAVALAVLRGHAQRWGALAWSLHGAVLLAGLGLDTPRFGFAPALSVTAWLVGLVYALERPFYPQLQPPAWLYALGAASLMLALIYPGAALQASASAWLPLHWALGIAAYGLFALAVLHAWMLQRAEARLRCPGQDGAGLPVLTLERLTFRFVGLGFALLTATLAAGWLFGSVLYPGHALRLDHKTVFSLLAWATFAALLLARWRLGWRGRRAVRVLYTGSALLLLAYVGSRFVLEVLLGRAM